MINVSKTNLTHFHFTLGQALLSMAGSNDDVLSICFCWFWPSSIIVNVFMSELKGKQLNDVKRCSLCAAEARVDDVIPADECVERPL